MSEFAGIDFAHPLTTETFDRTPEMRAERTGYFNGALERGMDVADANTHANEQMFRQLGQDIDTELRQRVTSRIEAELAVDGPSLDGRTLRAMTAFSLRSEMQELHEALPYPGLERIAEVDA